MKINVRFLLYIIICQAIILVTNWPFLTYRVREVPPGVISNYVHGGHVDYYTYLTFIRESKDGAWQVPALFTSEPSQPSFIYVYYIGLGKIAALGGLSPTAIYHLARFVGVEFFFLALYLLAVEAIGKKTAIWGIFLGLFSTPPLLFFGRQIWDTTYAGNWWYNLDILFRTDYVPHHQIAVAGMFMSLYLFLKYQRLKNIRLLAGSAVWAFVSAIVFPTPALVLITAVPLAILIKSVNIRKIQIRQLFRKLLPTIVLLVAILVPVLIIKNETLKGFPWSQWNVWDIEHWNRYPEFEKDFIGAGGLLLLLSIPAVIYQLYKRQNLIKVALSLWVILPYALLPFCDLLGLAKIRLGFLVNYVPMGLLTADYYGNITGRIRIRWARTAMVLAGIGFYGILSLPVTAKFYRDKAASYAYMGPEMIKNQDLAEAFNYLSENTSGHPVVLSDGVVGNMLPAYVAVTSYYGHPVHTYNYYQKMDQVRKFFSGQMSPTEVENLLTGGRVEYIFDGPYEKSLGGDLSSYNLNYGIVFRNSSVVIYKKLL